MSRSSISIALALALPTLSHADVREEINCLTEAVYFESRSESYAGQLVVALVVKNRAEDSRWPDTYCEVVHQGHQFSYYFDGKPELYHDIAAKDKAYQVANLVFFGSMLDFTEGAKYYHTLSVRPEWDYGKITPVGIFDNHIFYRDR